jgi:hypothetical protein
VRPDHTGRHKKRGPKRKPKRDYQREREHMLANKLDPSNARPVGAPDPVANATSHGVIAFRNQVKRRSRRGRSLIDRRSAAGKNAVAIGDQLLADLGGEANCSTAKLMLIEMVRRDVYFCDEIDRRIFKYIYDANTQLPQSKKNPKYISTLYSYRQGVVNNLSRNLLALGLEKAPPKQKSLEEILAEDEGEGQGSQVLTESEK